MLLFLKPWDNHYLQNNYQSSYFSLSFTRAINDESPFRIGTDLASSFALLSSRSTLPRILHLVFKAPNCRAPSYLTDMVQPWHHAAHRWRGDSLPLLHCRTFGDRPLFLQGPILGIMCPVPFGKWEIFHPLRASWSPIFFRKVSQTYCKAPLNSNL
jgi:hypothetical protein